VNTSDLPVTFDPGWTTRAPQASAHVHQRYRSTNAAPDLSITRVRAESISATAKADLDRYARFLKGWDGYDGEPIAPLAIDLAVAIIDALRSARVTHSLVDIIPGPASDGSLDLELRTTSRHLTITIYAGNESSDIEVRTLRMSETETEEKHGVEQAALVADLRWLLS
jgi:hypothetical protein